jgi:hypothetical protein
MVLIDLRPLKMFVLQKLSSQSIVRTVILCDNDFVNAEEYVAKVKVWLLLLRLETKTR